MRRVLFLAAALAGCAGGLAGTGGNGLASGECVSYPYESQFEYPVNPRARTTEGIAVDTSGQPVDLADLDRQTDEVEACLEQQFGSPPHIPDDVREAADCEGDTFRLPIARGCFEVKVPDDWQMSCDGHQQVLPSHAPDALCLVKGLVPTPECPCRWRAGIQDQHVIVATPDLHLYKDPLIRLVTGCNNPWAHPRLSACAMPDLPPADHDD